MRLFIDQRGYRYAAETATSASDSELLSPLHKTMELLQAVGRPLSQEDLETGLFHFKLVMEGLEQVKVQAADAVAAASASTITADAPASA